MIELAEELSHWRPARMGSQCAVATVIGVSGSAPRPVGTSMIVAASTTGAGIEVLGSLSGGCVEGAVATAALEVLESGGPRYERFGYSADDAMAVGLTCGGQIDIHIQSLSPDIVHALASGNRPVAIIRRLANELEKVRHIPEKVAFLYSENELRTSLNSVFPDDPELTIAATPLIEGVLLRGDSEIVRVRSIEQSFLHDSREIQLLVESRPQVAPRFLIVGANDFSAALIPFAKLLGYHVTLIDARPVFAEQERFAAADEVVIRWPHVYLAAEADAGQIDGRSVLCVLSHDPKFDIPLLDTALNHNLEYIGAMGSRNSHAQRIASLHQLGHQSDELTRLHSPIGLDLGAVTPAEVAVSITAEVVAGRTPNATTMRLSQRTGPIHAAHENIRSESNQYC